MILLYPGSFDPVTEGHIDIAVRGAAFADRLIIAVLDNPNKKTLFSVTERADFLRSVFYAKDKNFKAEIEVDSFTGLLAEYAGSRRVDAILRGVRSPGDFETEYRYAAFNRALSDGIETIYLPASPALSHISSSIVREAAMYVYSSGSEDTAIDLMVPPAVRDALENRFKATTKSVEG